MKQGVVGNWSLASFISLFTVQFLIAYMQYAKWREKTWFVYHMNDVYVGRWGWKDVHYVPPINLNV